MEEFGLSQPRLKKLVFEPFRPWLTYKSVALELALSHDSYCQAIGLLNADLFRLFLKEKLNGCSYITSLFERGFCS